MSNSTVKKKISFAFVKDIRGKILSPMFTGKAWKKVKKGQAKVLNTYPLHIQLNYEVDTTLSPDDSEFHLGIDPGDTTGLAVVQKCRTHNRTVFKANLSHRKDIHKLIQQRAMYRRLRRSHKKYRPARFNNRASSKRTGRLAPSIKARKAEIIRIINYKILKAIRLDYIHIEDNKFDIRAFTDQYKPKHTQYQISNRLDENLRLATIYRDNNACKLCGATNTRIEVHHIVPRRDNGPDSIHNLICLCSKCHSEVTNNEYKYKNILLSLIGAIDTSITRQAAYNQIGKKYLYTELQSLIKTTLQLESGADTANLRYKYDIEKTHSNDASLMTQLKLNQNEIDTVVYEIEPIRRTVTHKHDKTKEQKRVRNKSEFKLKDKVKFTKGSGKKKVTYKGILISILKSNNRGSILLENGYQVTKPFYKLTKIDIQRNFLIQ